MTFVPDSSGWMPHGVCYLWDARLVGLHAVSDTLIAGAYFTIPFTLVHFIRRRRDLPFSWMFVCFGVFILACGLTHALAVYNIWVPTWWLSGEVKAVTALASVPTAVLLARLVPQALALPSPAALREAHADLERRVEARAAELQSSEARLRAFLDNAPAIASLKDLDGRFLLANRGLETVVRRDRGAIEGLRDIDLFPAAAAAVFRGNDDAVAASGDAREFEEMVPQPDGDHLYSSVKFPLRGPGGRIVAVGAISTDITARRRTELQLHETERQLAQAQRLEAVGRLAGGVAHDFNNLLTVITGLSGMVAARLGDSQPALREDVEEIQRAGERAAQLTSQLLAFSRRQVLRPELLNLNVVVRHLDRIVGRVIGEDVRVVLALAPEIGMVRADRGQLEQVVMNLVVNARDAMPAGGTLTIETQNVELDATFANERLALRPGAYVMLAVSDTGVGMDAITQAHIFEPFFTTKDPGKGTGLGLSTVYGIVEQSGGTIYVYSEPGRGSAFKVYLPRVHGDAAAPAESAAQPSGAGERSPAGGRILLVEDEPRVRHFTARVLREAGYDVVEAANAEEALALAATGLSTFQLLITDVVLPGQHGPALAEALTERVPDLAVLFVSGYTDAVARQAIATGRRAFLEKPFSPQSLLARVRQALHPSGNGLGTGS